MDLVLVSNAAACSQFHKFKLDTDETNTQMTPLISLLFCK
jgi:hypothetical protein